MPDGATLIRPTSDSRIGLCLMALRLSGLHLAQDWFMPDGATLIRPTSGSRIGLCLMTLRLSGLHLTQELVYA
ncbi:hypothetical protein DSH02_05265 [Salmonella enterica subsp. enterica serovar Tchad]|nr:hypothetical protein [Salmonella enterica subsp. enterica serovar Tchad]ECA0361198.1 hypothetical protein [Salmonella enterica subsp. enterica serovar Tchad]ECG3412222.1 hypothetical protein [Salmonella enterica subsp. enterica serovar Tchad]ECO5911592.1 hypothetical protein [Salmonella enterica]